LWLRGDLERWGQTVGTVPTSRAKGEPMSQPLFHQAKAEKRATAFLRDLPNIHERGDRPPYSGGLNPRIGQVMIDEIGKLGGGARSIETGAGNSTLLFMMLGCAEVMAIAPDEKLGRRIRSEAAARGLDDRVLRYINDRSERALPRLALDEDVKCEIGFIDGNHGWPSVFVDFCYLNMMMQRDAVLFVDDVQLYSCAQLMLLLKSQPEFELVSVVGKLATFRKRADSRFLPDFGSEPFIVANTSAVVLGG
jgi:Methyltransferase domain